MGNYNPHAPILLGEEWVPIRDEQTSFSPWVNLVEYGHGFRFDTTRIIQEGRIYVDDIPANLASDEITCAIYPRGLEAASGPIRRVVIPVDSASATGATQSPSTISGAAILLTPDFGGNFLLDSDVQRSQVFMTFNTQEYVVLTGKRILAVNLIYAAHRFESGTSGTLSPPYQDFPFVALDTDFSSFGGQVLPDVPLGPITTIGTNGAQRFRFSMHNPYGSNGLPWTHPVDIGRFDASSASKIYVAIKMGQDFSSPPNFAMYFWYAGLEIIYCEEQRLIYGRGLPTPGGLATGEGPTWGANVITLRSMAGASGSLLPSLDPGEYTVVVGTNDLGDSQSPYTAGMRLNALRELYAIPPHPGIQVDIPYPPENHIDGQFSAIQTHILPQISLHATGGTLTEPHVYGRLGKAPVYDGIFATQDIYDDISGVAADYPWVRFYARKYDTTTVPLKLDSTNVTGSGINVQITPAEHDALPEIIDGWKECTLRFPAAPSMGTVPGDPAWRFTSVGEQAGSQWQVLAACAPAVSGVPGSVLTQSTPVHRLGTATYQPPAGDTVELTWMSPFATGAVLDPSCDAVLIFSQDPPLVTGVSISQATQAITGVPLDCGGVACCIVTGIGYNRITWGLPANTGIADDDYARTVAAGGWGTASDGKAWTVSGVAADFSVDPTTGGIIDISTTGTNRVAWVDVGGPDQDVTVDVRIDEAAESGSLLGGAVARLADANNFYMVYIAYTSGNIVQLVLAERVAGVEATLQTVTLGSLKPAHTTPRKVRLQIQGAYLRAKAWDSDQPEPPWWQINTTDASLTTGNNAGVFARDDTGAATSIWYITSFTVRPPDHAFGGLELQRFDGQTGVFETIMLASSPAVTGFNDYEARVGQDSVYRIRNVNIYNFTGPWSIQVTGGPAAPGVTGNQACDLTGALIFTSNADQSGARNRAYVMQWQQDPPTEGFALPEAQRINFQELYTRDGRVAFHGTERGLEAFSRQILIQAGTADPKILANVKTLRDLAWADLPYLCVRDDDGNRWYANVRIPDVAVQDDRTKYLATVDVVETSTEPCIVDPA